MSAPLIFAPDRTTYVGGSDVAAVLGVSPWTSPLQLYLTKIGEYAEEITEEKLRLFGRGKRWEPIVIEMLIDELRARGHHVDILAKSQRYQDPELPFLAAEIDLELLVDGEPTNCEAKTVNPFALKQWGPDESDEVPVYYAAQVMHGLMIKPTRRAIVAAVSGFDDRPLLYWIDRDDETIAGIRAREIEFWQRVQDRDPPDPETAADVRWLYATDDGATIEADDELLALCNGLKAAKAAIKAETAHAAVIETQIKARIKHAAIVLRDGQKVATWKSNKASKKTDWQAAYLDLSPAADHVSKFITETDGNRPLLIK
jgi:putative phage-type endonuclease